MDIDNGYLVGVIDYCLRAGDHPTDAQLRRMRLALKKGVQHHKQARNAEEMAKGYRTLSGTLGEWVVEETEKIMQVERVLQQWRTHIKQLEDDFMFDAAAELKQRVSDIETALGHKDSYFGSEGD